MAKRESGQSEEEKKHTKKLQRREKLLSNRLQEAQERYDSAQESLKQAEERVQKRKGSVERLEGRLLFVRQQLVGNKVASVEEVKAEYESEIVEEAEEAEEVSPAAEEAEEIEPLEKEEELPEAEPLEEQEASQVVEEEAEQVQGNAAEKEMEVVEPVLEEESVEEPVLEEEELAGPVLEEKGLVAEPVLEEEGPVEESGLEEEETGLVLEEGEEPVEEPVAEPILEEEEEPVEEPILEEEEKPVEESGLEEEEEPVEGPILEEEEKPVSGPAFTDDIINVLSESRRLAETAERAARVAVARTDHLFEHLEHILNGRYLQQEVEQLQGEAESLSALARRARKIVEAAIALSTKAEPEEELAFLAREIEEQWQVLGQIRMSFENDFEEEPVEDLTEEEGNLWVTAESALDMSVDEVVFDLPESAFSHEVVSGEPEEVERVMPPFPLDVIEEVVNTQIRESGQIEQLNEEEKEVEAVTAMLIANAAAAAAAEAEALAEASGQHTREAYATAIQSDQLVKQIRAAIQLGTLNGEEAEAVLRQVERAATYAHAALADAEAAEERAVSAAINAEAEAEVAEGMALSSQERERDLEEEEAWVTQTDKHRPASDETLRRARVEADEAEIRKSASSQQEFA